MRTLESLRFLWLLTVACAIATPAHGIAGEPTFIGALTPVDDWVGLIDNPIMLVSQVERSTQPFEAPAQPFEAPTQPFEPPTTATTDTGPSFRSSSALRSLLQSEQPTPTSDSVSRGEVGTTAPTDLGSLLQNSDNVQTLNAQRRTPIAFDPHVRGYRFGEIYAQSAGEWFQPARLDLDSMLSKIDPNLIQSVTVIPGPYGLQYGPGMAFINVTPIDTPRSTNGCTQWSNRFNTLYRGNGNQILVNDTVSGAGQGYGFIANYGLRTGADYFAGNGQRIPSSFHSQNALLQQGFDTENGRVEFRYNRFDMWNTEYALQFFDISSMRTDSYNVSYAGVDPVTGAANLSQVWYNQTGFDGNNLNASKAELRQRVANGLNNDFNTRAFTANDFQGFVSGQLVNTGARTVRTYGDETAEYTRIGTDVRYLTQSTTERFHINNPAGTAFLTPDEQNFFTNMPHSAMTDPGMFAEYGTPWTSFFKTAIGGRLDYVNTHPRVADMTNPPIVPGLTNVNLVQNDTLLSGYMTGQLELTQEWTVRSGVGYAERVPDLVNRYSNGVFLSVLQDGFSKVVGDPSLKKERATQIDTSLLGNYGYMTGRVSAFYSWINDYNTYASFGVDPPTGAHILVAQNTALATLGGFEMYGDYRANDVTTFFASGQYVQGTDHVIDKPLPQIYPLQGRFGVRWADPMPMNMWGLEWGFRVVARQNRIGFLRDDFNAATAVAVETPTAGFYTSYVRGYYNLSQNVHLTGGIDNMFNRNYLEHLDRRLTGPAQTVGGVTAALAPGFTAYFGLEWLM